jgi:aminoglycoside/choline kinase family phosphotransferase
MEHALARFFAETFGHPPTSVVRIAGDGSQRLYVRLGGAARGSVVGAWGPDPDENRAFLSFSRTFRGIGLPVPEIIAADESRAIWLMEDLGDITLFQALSQARASDPAEFPASMLAVYERVVEILPRFQIEGGRVIDFSVAYPRAAFDEQSMRWDLNYFKYHFLKLAHVPFNEQRLENDFDRLVAFLLRAETQHFLYRDFQSRNIMLREGQPWFIDYQGGRRGAPQYDIASLLYDAKAAIPEAAREQLLQRYVDTLATLVPLDRPRFLELFRGYVLIRIMQAMGAYGYRGFFERKSRFLESVPYAARNIARLLAAGLPVALPEIESVFHAIVAEWAGRDAAAALSGLTVHISSFSYRHGLPADESGHGGGFIFDCRALPNPGRYREFMDVTGRDAPVIAFLEAAPEVEAFWRHVVPLVETHVENFRQRGFTDLAVAFGCTGGQHRSVFFAERLKRLLQARWPDLTVQLQHREQPQWPAPPPPSDVPDAAEAAAAQPIRHAAGTTWTR